MTREEVKGAIEALLFITDRPLSFEDLKKLSSAGEEDVAGIVEELRGEYEARGGVRLLNVAEGWQMATRQEHGAAIRSLYQDRTTFRLSTAALETLAIVAYRQPLTRAEIEQIRGVEVIAALETLLERRLLKVVGRKEAIGRPLLYGTTQEFLRQFGLASLEQLPSLDSLPVPETPVPAAADSATASLQGPFSTDDALESAVETPLHMQEELAAADAAAAPDETAPENPQPQAPEEAPAEGQADPLAPEPEKE